jgi:hypothetical protein
MKNLGKTKCEVMVNKNMYFCTLSRTVQEGLHNMGHCKAQGGGF